MSNANPNQVLDQWYLFKKMAIPATAPAIQIREMKRAYFAGAYSLLAYMKDLPDDEDQSVALLEAIEQECKKFFERVERGLE